jgi:glycerol-3-phosphate dehydrogenase
VDDARLVVLNARDAADRGAQVRTGCRVTALTREGEVWRIETPQGQFRARAVVNAAGPGALTVLGLAGVHSDRRMRLVRGSHIVVRRLFDHAFAYFFQLPDGRIFFAIPYERDFTLIGTTDRDHDGGEPQASAEEVAYLCEGASRFFKKPVLPEDVVWTYSGVRPLIDDGSGKPEAATRGYRFELSDVQEGPPILTVLGGKITTYRHLAEEALDLLASRLPVLDKPSWTGRTPLPGGDFPVDGVDAQAAQLVRQYPFLEPAWARRLTSAYGTLAATILGDAKDLADCGRHFGLGFTARELKYLIDQEWARTAEDVLWRRSKLGLHFSAEEAENVKAWMESEVNAPGPSPARGADSSCAPPDGSRTA